MKQNEMVEATLSQYRPDQIQRESLRVLGPGDEFLQDLVDRFFETRLDSNAASVACFYETKSTNVGAVVGTQARREFVVNESSGCLDPTCSTEKHPLARTHFDINKFGKPSEPSYKVVCSVVKKMVEESPGLLAARIRYDGKHNVPFSLKGVPLVTKFVRRDAEILRLEDYFLSKTFGPTRRKVFVIHGLGGMGKTQLAIEFARKHCDRFSAVFWLNGSSNHQLKQAFVSVASRLSQIGIATEGAEVLNQPDTDINKVVEGVLRWLSLPSNRDWLLIIDNVDRDHLHKDKDPQAYDVQDFFPEADHGSILITSRLAGHRYEDQKLDEVHAEQAKAILENNAGKSIKDGDLIIKQLSGFPLALTQAGSYLRQTNMAASDYIKHYKSTWTELMKKQDRFPLQEYSDRSVLTTWTISYQQVKYQSEEAAGLLRLWGYLDCGDLWYDLIASASDLDESEELPDWLQRLTKSELDYFEALQILSHYSLVDSKLETSGHSIHPVLHDWCSQLAEGNERKFLHWCAASIVAHMVPDVSSSESWKMCKRLLPHGSRIYQMMNDQGSEQFHEAIDWAMLPHTFFCLGRIFDEQSKPDQAEEMYQQALRIQEKTDGEDPTTTLEIVSQLGILYQNRGTFDEAEKMYERALRGRVKTLGMEHILTLGTINSLGILYLDQDKPDQAEKMLQRAFQGHERAFGMEHASRLDILNNLGSLYRTQGKFDEAEEIYRRTIIGKEKAHGVEHLSTLETIFNLGNLYLDQGRADEAEDTFQKALKGHEKAFGVEHELKFKILDYLGAVYGIQGRFDEAEDMFQRTITGEEKIYGMEHLSTLHTIFNLGNLYRLQGRLDEAEKMFERVLTGGEKVFSAEHGFILDAAHMLSGIYHHQGKLDQAKKMHQRFEEGLRESRT